LYGGMFFNYYGIFFLFDLLKDNASAINDEQGWHVSFLQSVKKGIKQFMKEIQTARK
jgi:hypothetical protein